MNLRQIRAWGLAAFVLLSGSPFIAPVVFAQGAKAQADAKSDADRQIQWREAMAEAKALALAGKLVQAENALTAFNFTKPGTAEWYEQTAVQLMRLGAAFAAEGNAAAQRAVAARALDNLQSAERLARTPAMLAQVRGQSGRIQERVFNDLAAAKESYRQATVADPSNKNAKGALDRLEKAENALAAKSIVKG